MKKMKYLASFLAAAMVVTTVPYTAPITTSAAIEATSDVTKNGNAVTGYSGDAASLTRMVIPDNATSIESGAFYSDVYPNLVEMVIRNDSITIKDKAFGYDSKGVLESGNLVVWCNEGSTAQTYAKKIGATVKYLNSNDISIVSGSSEYYSGCESFKITSTVPSADSTNKDGDIVWKIDDTAFKNGTMWFQEGNKKVQETTGKFVYNGDGATMTSTATIYVIDTANMSELQRSATVTADCRGTGASDSKTFAIKKASSKIDIKATVYAIEKNIDTQLPCGKAVEYSETITKAYLIGKKIKTGYLSDGELLEYVNKGYIVTFEAEGDENCLDIFSVAKEDNDGLESAMEYFAISGKFYDVTTDNTSKPSSKNATLQFAGIIDSDDNVVSDDIYEMLYVKSKEKTNPTLTFLSSNNNLTKVVTVIVSVLADSVSVSVGGKEAPNNSTVVYIEGSRAKLTYSATPADVTTTAEWVSSDSTVAKIVNDEVQFVGPGKATITCNLKDSLNNKDDIEVSSKFTVVVYNKVLYSGMAFVTSETNKEVINNCYVAKNGTYNLYVNDVKNGQVYIAGKDETAANEQVSFISADDKIAKVNEQGVVTGVGVGTTTITAYATDHPDVKATIEVTVYTSVSSIVSNDVATSVVGQTTLIPYSFNPTSASEEVTWNVENDAIAVAEDYVDEQGKRYVKVTGKQAGTTKIEGTTIPTGATKRITLVVEEPVHADSINFVIKSGEYTQIDDNGTPLYKVEKGKKLTFAYELVNNSGKKVNDVVEWTYEAGKDAATVSVNDTGDMVIDTKKDGEFWVSITATGYTNDGKEVVKTSTVNVKVYTPAQSVSIKTDGKVVDVYDYAYGDANIGLIGTINPSACTEKIEWTVSDESIATISVAETDSNGKTYLVPKKMGRVTVTARTETGKVSSVIVNIYKPVKNISFISEGADVTTLYVPVGASKRVDLKIDADADTTDTEFTWTRSPDAGGAFTVDPSADGKYATITGVLNASTSLTVKGNSATSGKAYKLNIVVVTPADNITLGQDKYEIYKTGTITLAPDLSCNDSRVPNDNVTWTIADDSIATITEGAVPNTAVVTGVSKGTTKAIGTTSTGKTVEATIVVKAKTFDVDNATITVGGVVVENGASTYSAQYTGSEIKPTSLVVKVRDEETGNDVKINNTELNITYKNNINVGTATMVIEPNETSVYSGKIEVKYAITAKVLPAASFVTLKSTDIAYGGAEQKPSFDYKDSKTGKNLVEGTDYTVIYENNINAGTGKIVITGKGNYSGTVTKTFTIAKRDISKGDVTVEGLKNFAYAGTDISKNIQKALVVKYKELKLVSDVDFTVVCKNASGIKVLAKNVGTYYVYVVAKGTNFTGEYKVGAMKINAKSIANTTVTAIVNPLYTGSAIKKTPAAIKDLVGGKTVTLAKDTDYTLTYTSSDSNKCIRPGVVTVTIKGKGNYTSSKKITYVILPPAVKNLKMASNSANAIKLSWSKVSGATGYNIYLKSGTTFKKVGTTTGNTITISKLSAGKDYSYRVIPYVKTTKIVESTKYTDVNAGTKPGAVTISKLTSTVRNGANISWKKVNAATTYEIYVATSKTGTYKKVKSATSLSTAITGLSGGKTCYFKVRAGRKINGVIYYGAFSAIKSVMIKK